MKLTLLKYKKQIIVFSFFFIPLIFISVFKVDYNLILLDGQWKLRNVVINGINIGLQFRSQFQASMSKNKNNLDEVIAGWSVDSR